MRPPLILDVNPNPEALAWQRGLLKDMSIPVVGCCGPELSGGCPLLRGEHCPKVDAADGVIFQLDLDRPEHRRILVKYMVELDAREAPLRVVVTEEQKRRWPKLLERVEVFTPPVGVAKLDAFAAEVVGGWGKGEQ